ncbi:uncharacterized protein B0I36DRAFT_367853 [Microdochium trichocladiopsis]|uniref:EKC/KEOPS complex subunit GON7 n=1 Tax=Microdochium trichocladiopsis TaxID=1682393 RepID=A0A9P8XWZ0_9PEZI|nr:uncharacterized protein B0I36DRAFT_367853 [Microdochium trichocladiopsis]KAH7021441.1 hypothetical protein B0I36DRAFT_367853 [Microdochium trichocladiopsis]
MAADSSSSSSQPRLTATYTSPTNEAFTLPSEPIPVVTSASSDPATAATAQQKQAALSALRTAAVQMQQDINALLTARMDEDNQRAAAAAAALSNGTAPAGEADKKTGAKNKAQTVDEDAEEDNYGEEVVDEDE